MPTEIPDHDGYTQDEATGEVVIAIGGAGTYIIRAPRMGGYRELDAIMAAAGARAAAEGEAEPEGAEPSFEDRNRSRIEAHEWWTKAYEVAGRSDQEWPAGDLPLWLHANLASRAMEHWADFPTKALGPSRLERAMGSLAATMSANGSNASTGPSTVPAPSGESRP